MCTISSIVDDLTAIPVCAYVDLSRVPYNYSCKVLRRTLSRRGSNTSRKARPRTTEPRFLQLSKKAVAWHCIAGVFAWGASSALLVPKKLRLAVTLVTFRQGSTSYVGNGTSAPVPKMRGNYLGDLRHLVILGLVLSCMYHSNKLSIAFYE